jgi:hypothetical protein
LGRRLHGSFVCDPELVGFGMRRMLPPVLRSDFQDLPPWRQSVRYLLAHTPRLYPGPVIVSMTLINAAYFDEIIGGLRADGADVHHFPLLAELGTILPQNSGTRVGVRIQPRSLGRRERQIPGGLSITDRSV